jgi:hypothetical protein
LELAEVPRKIIFSSEGPQNILPAFRYRAEIHEIGAMEGHPLHLGLKGQVKESDIAVAQKYFGEFLEGRKRQPGKQPATPVSSTDADDGGYRRIGNGPDEVLRTVRLSPHEVAVLEVNMLPGDDVKA